MPPLVEYCLGNMSQESLEHLQQSSCETRAKFCLDRCGDCCSVPFLVVDGELRKSTSHASLLDDVDRDKQ